MRSARRTHRGGVLSLTGPAELIDLIERSLFTAGVITQRVKRGDATIGHDRAVQDSMVRLQVEAGFLVLHVSEKESEQLVAHVGGRELILEDTNRSGMVAAVHQLLHQAEILYDTERVGL